MRTLSLAAAIWALLCAVCCGQITVPDKVAPHEPIVAQLTADLPAGAQIQGGWSSTTAKYLPTGDPKSVHIWAAPGQHQIAFRGAWVQTRSIEINGEQVQVLVGFGFVDHTASFTVGEDDDINPPPPPPPGDRWGIVVEETTQRTPAQAQLWLQARQQFPLNKLLIIDQHSLAPSVAKYVSAAREANLPLPVLVVVSESGAVVETRSCPVSVSEIKRILGHE